MPVAGRLAKRSRMGQRAIPSGSSRHSYHPGEPTVKNKKLDYRVQGLTQQLTLTINGRFGHMLQSFTLITTDYIFSNICHTFLTQMFTDRFQVTLHFVDITLSQLIIPLQLIKNIVQGRFSINRLIEALP